MHAPFSNQSLLSHFPYLTLLINLEHYQNKTTRKTKFHFKKRQKDTKEKSDSSKHNYMMGYHAKRSLEEKNDERDKQLIKDKQELTYAVTKKKT